MIGMIGRLLNYLFRKRNEWVAELVRLAKEDNTEAQTLLGAIYARGNDVLQDYPEAVKWYRKAAEQGNAEAQYRLGDIFENGDTEVSKIIVRLGGVEEKGVPQDYAEAVKWYLLAAEQGHDWAQYSFGSMYEHGRGISENDAEAVKWYRKAAEQGNAFAQTDLGHMYARGRGVSQDDAEAVKWYRRTAEQGYQEAQHILGFMYTRGRGVPQNDVEAAKWYRKAAEQGYLEAQDCLGIMFRDGRGVPQDDVQAYAWLNLAGSGKKDELRENITAEEIAQARKLSINLYLREFTRLQQGHFELRPRSSVGLLRGLQAD